MEGNLPFLLCFTLYFRAISDYKAPVGLYLEGRVNGGFLRYKFGGLIPGGAYFGNFTVSHFHLIMLHDRWGDHKRDYMNRQVTSPTWGLPPPCNRPLKELFKPLILIIKM